MIKKIVKEKTENNKKKNIVLTAVFVTIAITVLLTWIFPVTYYSNGSIVEDVRNQVGLFNLFEYPITAISYFGNIAVYILLIGGFYSILYNLTGYRKILDKVVEVFKGKENLFIAIVIALLGIFTSVCGASLGLLMAVPFIISILILMGYNKITAVMATVGAIAVGLIGTTFSSTYVTDEYSLLAQNGTGILNTILNISAKSQIWIKIVLLVVGLIILIVNTIIYANKHRVNSKTLEEDFAPKTTKAQNKNEKIWPIVLIFDLVILIALLSLTSWTTVFGIKFFSDITTKFVGFKLGNFPISLVLLIICNCLLIIKKEKLRKIILIIDVAFMGLLIVGLLLNVIFNITLITNIFSFAISKAPLIGKAFDIEKSLGSFLVFGKLFNGVKAFELWTVNEIGILLILASVLLAIIYKIKISDYIKCFVDGIKRAAKPAAIVVLIYTILVIVSYHPIVLTIIKPFAGAKKLNVLTMSIYAFVSNFFNIDLYYSATSTLQYAISTIKDTGVYSIIAVIWQSMYGLIGLVAPTSIVLMVSLSYLHVSYIEWIKAAWKLMLEMLLFLLVVFAIAILIV